ncbi:Ferredoxin (4Fe-4S iron-sulfur cluster binding protein) [Desulfamplus magnetovallimortis]|uniref:Ferredoxin (4Fe-4S iron-sulfur cluster binding protein) n=1 Tax=Desulfamplus magnetovallimortis TaxID=1246637 RepID=A0A1W1H6U1_9BACT|nr:ferredoxin [Desulfamplus magnetovallimortis]SLM28146.1 Ferredoxin (4Fe-4S iron-sulfur cluster binding protein) [Desulfamplus magnetovallimortis]
MIKHGKPVIDLSECVLCDICVELCPDVFIKNSSDYIEVSENVEQLLYDDHGNLINPSLLEDIKDAIKTCRGDCISWDEKTETKSV